MDKINILKNIIILNGPPRCGKDTAALIYQNMGYIHLKFSQSLKDEAHKRYGVQDYSPDFFETYKDTPLMELDGFTPREVYIDVGTELRNKYGSDIFGRMIADRIRNSSETKFVISDLASEVEARPVLDIDKAHITLVKIQRHGKTFQGDCRNYVDIPSSNTVKTITLSNNGSVEDYANALRKTALQIEKKRDEGPLPRKINKRASPDI